jgi:hypothetical protein
LPLGRRSAEQQLQQREVVLARADLCLSSRRTSLASALLSLPLSRLPPKQRLLILFLLQLIIFLLVSLRPLQARTERLPGERHRNHLHQLSICLLLPP